ncbi:MAG: NAD-dependent epimerase/dehydratase family protein [Janthinobacterium lividum]
MHIVVTGGSGKLGGAVVERLLASGHQVTNVDARPAPGSAARFLRIDLTDYGQVVEALTGIDDAYDAVDAVVHLAAIPAPGLTANAATFANNVPSTFHVFQAAKLAGIRKIVWASSETVLGLPFDDAPAYVPVDEAVSEPNSTYSLGKVVEEAMAAQFCRWDPDLSMVGLRFSNVMLVDDYAAFGSYTADQRRFNLWSYIDARDAAQAVELALAYEPHGVEVFVIASPDVVPHVPVEQLLAERFGEVEHTRELGEYESPLSIDKARSLLGYDPKHSWRDHVPAP